MSRKKRNLKWLLSVGLAVVLLLSFGCENQGLLTPRGSAQDSEASLQPVFLTPQNTELDKSFLPTLQLTDIEYVTTEEGGTVEVGTSKTGYNNIHFLPNDLEKNSVISFNWDAKSFRANLGPHGLVFRNPVSLTLSYKNANLRKINEENLRIWYYNETTNAWELVGGKVNTKEKTVVAFIKHFSTYALGDMP